MSGQHTGKVWAPEELDLLAKIFPTTTTPDLVPIFGCSVKVIQRIAGRYGIKKDLEWLKQFKSALAKASYAKGGSGGFKKGNIPWNANRPNEYHKDSRPRKGSVFTGHGYQDIQVVPGGRIITHKISDVSVRSA